MKRWLHKIELITDKAITPCLILLLAIIIIEFGFKDMTEQYGIEPYINIADYVIIAVFVTDLTFKYNRTRSIPLFFRRYWLDIIAVFPFFLLFRTYEFFFGAAALSEGAQTAQAVIHEGVEIEKEGAKIVREAEKIMKEGGLAAREAEAGAKTTRSARLIRFIRPILRLPRLAKAAPKIGEFYEKPVRKHTE